MMLTKSFASADFGGALAEWSGLDLTGTTPVMASLFGDVFFESDPAGCWFLRTIEGALTRPWRNRDELVAALDTTAGQDKWLMGVFAVSADRRGVTLAQNEVYVFAPHPDFTGKFDVASIMAMSCLCISTRR